MELNKIYNMDCVLGLKMLGSGSIDLTVTSPPYDNLRSYNGFDWDFESTASELYRVTKDGGVVVWIVADSTVNGSETGTSFRQALHFKEIGFNLHDTMIYMKDNPPPVGGSNRYYQTFEYIFILSKGAPKTFNPISEPRRNKWNDKRTSRCKAFTREKDGSTSKKQVQLNTGNVKRRNVWTYVVGGGNVTTDKFAYQHPAIYPEQLANDHIISWSNPDDVVMDPFLGSGTTAKMAKINNRKYIGFEISQEYCEIANRRVTESTVQTRMII